MVKRSVLGGTRPPQSKKTQVLGVNTLAQSRARHSIDQCCVPAAASYRYCSFWKISHKAACRYTHRQAAKEQPAAPFDRHRSAVRPPSQSRSTAIAEPSDRHQGAVRPPSGRRPTAIAAPSHRRQGTASSKKNLDKSYIQKYNRHAA